MKLFISLLLFSLVISSGLRAQPPGAPGHKSKGPAPIMDSAYYMHESKKLNRGSWITLGIGAALFIVGDLVYKNNSTGSLNGFNAIPGTFLMILGGTSAIVSIVLFTKAANYKEKANTISLILKHEDFPRLAQLA